MATAISIFNLSDLGAAPASNDVTVIVDVSDPSQAPQGTTKKLLISELFTSVTITTSLTVTGTATISSTLNVAGDFSVATNKLTVAAATGNTVIAGTLNVAGDFSVATNKLTVAAASGNAVSAGSITAVGNLTGDDVFAAAGSAHRWTGRSIMSSPADGRIALFNLAETDFSLLMFGGLTSSFPALRRSAAALDVVLADASAFATLNVGALTTQVGGITVANGLTVSAGTTAVQALTATTVTATSNVIAGAATGIGWTGRTIMHSPSDGVLEITNNAGTDFGRLQFGGTTSSFPAIKRSAAVIALRLADDSADAALTAAAITSSGAITSTSASGGVGYTTGAGGTVTQSTDKSTAVTLNKVTGQITLNNSSVGSGAVVSFTVNNSTIVSTDTVVVNHASAGTAGAYHIEANHIINVTSFAISVHNVTAGALAEAIVLNYAILRGVSS